VIICTIDKDYGEVLSKKLLEHRKKILPHFVSWTRHVKKVEEETRLKLIAKQPDLWFDDNFIPMAYG